MHTVHVCVQVIEAEQSKYDAVAKGRRDAKSAMNRIKGRPMCVGLH